MHPSQSPLYRLFKMRLPAGALCALPLVLVVVWYAWAAWAQVDRYRRVSEDESSWSVELFHIALHDELRRDWRRVVLPSRPAASGLPTFSLSLDRANFDALNRPLRDDSKRVYAKGYVQKDGVIHAMQVRYRGSKPWHWLGPQKTMKLRLESGDLIDGTRIFNLINEPTPFGMEDQIILDLARELGLLSPEYHPVRVRLNNADMGVYRYAAQPVEGLLRRGRRMQGPLYSGDSDSLDTSRGVGDLFFSRQGWQQVAGLEGPKEAEFAELDRLLAQVQGASHAEFAAYVQQRFDLQRYALFDALDVVFGGNEHDYFSNHKLYFDPYRGRFEPVAWGFRGFRHEPVFNLVDHPLLIRLKMTPGYLAWRDRAVFELLTGVASVPKIRARVDRLFEALGPDLESDPFWDAYKLLPRVSRFHRFMVRPMTKAHWLLAARYEIHNYGQRARFLLDRLERNEVVAGAYRVGAATARVDVRVDGHTARRLRQVTALGPCQGPVSWYADVDRDGRLGQGDAAVAQAALGAATGFDAYAELAPGIRLVPHPEPKDKVGTVQVRREARRYSYLLTAPCAVEQVVLVLDDPVTGASAQLVLPVGAAEDGPTDDLPAAASVPDFVAGQRSAHPWDFGTAPRPETLVWGPGTVSVPETRIFGPQQTVVIKAGTRLAMGPGVSLIFRGPVFVEGTVRQPVVVSSSGPRPFGGIALQGAATAGSVLKHVQIEGGTQAEGGGIAYGAVLSLRDSRELTVEGLRVVAPGGEAEGLHVTYVEDIRLYEVQIERAPADAVDLEFTSGQVRGLRVQGAGDDCLDLMGVDLRMADSVLRDCANNALSVGEESDLSVHGLFVSDSRTGVLAKNASHARITRSLFYRTGTVLKTKKRDVHYDGASSIGASELFAAECDDPVDEAKGTRIAAGQIQRVLPPEGALEHLARHVLGLATWDALERHLAAWPLGMRL